MTTPLHKELRRQVTVEGQDYTVSLDADGMRLTGKGKRKPEVELRWRDLLSGEAALAVALNASLADTSSRTARGPGAPRANPPTRAAGKPARQR